MKKRIILASGSPRRKEMLERIGLDFEIIKSNCKEIITKTNPDEIVMELALCKAKDVAQTLKEEGLVIAADTIVVYDKKIMGKPKDEKEAFEMLSLLQNNTHEVYTGVCIMDASKKEEVVSFYEKTDVYVCEMTKKQIEDYIATKDPFDKAGAYGIQGIFGKYIKGINGSYDNVVGLPLGRLYKELLSLKEKGYDFDLD
ncbi:septum formation protein [Acetitomaculum ruminis DSM 5522]|uniref:dTTP/UTP pyrophosphatase n=1 Tax=Acetitomaculum ruminis DSM 5522 TaxID=1120918 RepID=A0A1I0ZUF5_9FIRM|nr:Maf family protein [Acetitomaculum ruminis]SFB28050.1 septum formation protein [Acetitomaculum ruminis DSM 5522]